MLLLVVADGVFSFFSGIPFTGSPQPQRQIWPRMGEIETEAANTVTAVFTVHTSSQPPLPVDSLKKLDPFNFLERTVTGVWRFGVNPGVRMSATAFQSPILTPL